MGRRVFPPVKKTNRTEYRKVESEKSFPFTYGVFILVTLSMTALTLYVTWPR